MHKYRLIRKLGEGTFSEVLKAQSLRNGQNVAIKCMKSHFDSIDQVNNLREIKALQRLYPHPHIIQLIEILYDEPTGRLALVFELMEQNMYEAIKGRPNYLPEQRVKHYMYQLIKAIEHMHRNGIFHRDIKPENILLNGETVKLADLGSCRGLYQDQPLTEYISTRWYRAPECLLTDGYYSYKMDIWGVGCVMYEILSLCPLFPGDDELDQINKIHDIIGTPSKQILEFFRKHATHMEINFPEKKWKGFAKMIPHVSAEGSDIIEKMLIYDKDERWTASQLLKHPYFKEFRDFEHQQISQFTAGPQGFARSISSNLADNLSQYSRRNSDNASDVEVGSGMGIPSQMQGIANAGQTFLLQKPVKKAKKVDKKKIQHSGQGGKKFPELKMMVNGDYRSSNYTMSSDDEVFNFPPIKKSLQHQQHLKDIGSVYNNQIVKPIQKKKPNPKLTMNMAGLGGYNPHHGNQYVITSNNLSNMNSMSQNMMMQSAAGVNSTMQVNQMGALQHQLGAGGTGTGEDPPQQQRGGSIPPLPNQSSHEFKMKHNSSNQSFHSQKKIGGAGGGTVGGGGGGMSTIRKPGGGGAGAAAAGPSLDNSFTNHHNNSINGGGVHGIQGQSVANSGKIVIQQYAGAGGPGGAGAGVAASSSGNVVDQNGNTSNMTNKGSQYNKYMSPYQKNNINKKNSGGAGGMKEF